MFQVLFSSELWNLPDTTSAIPVIDFCRIWQTHLQFNLHYMWQMEHIIYGSILNPVTCHCLSMKLESCSSKSFRQSQLVNTWNSRFIDLGMWCHGNTYWCSRLNAVGFWSTWTWTAACESADLPSYALNHIYALRNASEFNFVQYLFFISKRFAFDKRWWHTHIYGGCFAPKAQNIELDSTNFNANHKVRRCVRYSLSWHHKERCNKSKCFAPNAQSKQIICINIYRIQKSKR